MEVTRFFDRLRVGVEYYPDQWPRSRWDHDASLMEKAGITVVRLAVFAWHLFEPTEGEYEFGWVDDAIAVLARHHLSVIMCTSTGSYPAWLHRKCPDIHQVDGAGRIKEFGQRQDACKNHPRYRKHALDLTEAIAKHFGDHPAVVAWQTDNELGCHGTARCYCTNCEREFQIWLERHFDGDVSSLNTAWGTAFWGHQYNAFNEISVPRDTADRTGGFGHNPGLAHSFLRFSSDVQVTFNRELKEKIGRYSHGRPITHNLMGSGFSDIDYFKLSEDLDVVSWDNYPIFRVIDPSRPPSVLPHALMRGLKRRNVWVMEQAVGAGGWERISATPEPGRVRVWAFQAIARGSDFIHFFRWRSARYGTEQYWQGILPHDGRLGARYEEVARFASELKKIRKAVAGSAPTSDVAIVFDYDSLWSLQLQPHSPSGIDFYEIADRFAVALTDLGVSFDIISSMNLAGSYRMVILPASYVSQSAQIGEISAFVSSGGVAVIGARSFVKAPNNELASEEDRAAIGEILGCTIEDFDVFSSLGEGIVQIADRTGRRFSTQHLAEILQVEESATVLMTYLGRYYSGAPAVVRNSVGCGSTFYVGTFPGPDAIASILLEALMGASIVPIAKDPSVEIAARQSGHKTVRFYLNHSTVPKRLKLITQGQELLSGMAVDGELLLEPLGVAVVAESVRQESETRLARTTVGRKEKENR